MTPFLKKLEEHTALRRRDTLRSKCFTVVRYPPLKPEFQTRGPESFGKPFLSKQCGRRLPRVRKSQTQKREVEPLRDNVSPCQETAWRTRVLRGLALESRDSTGAQTLESLRPERRAEQTLFATVAVTSLSFSSPLTHAASSCGLAVESESLGSWCGLLVYTWSHFDERISLLFAMVLVYFFCTSSLQGTFTSLERP